MLNYWKTNHENQNHKGPEIEPCGTPQSIKRLSAILSMKGTFCTPLDKYDLNQIKAIPQTPYEESFSRRILWCTQNQMLLENSRKIETKTGPLSRLS